MFSLVSAGEEPAAEEQPEAAPSLPSEPVLEAASEDSIAESAAPTTHGAAEATETEAVEIDAVLKREIPTAPAPPPEDAAATDDSVGAVVERRGVEEPAVTVETVAAEIAEETEAKITVDAEPGTEAEVVTGEDKNACTGECSMQIRHSMPLKQAYPCVSVSLIT